MKIIKLFPAILLPFIFATACNDFLDIIPDNVATIDNAFTNRYNAEKFLFTCYSYMPRHQEPSENPGFYCGYEMWMSDDIVYSSWRGETVTLWHETAKRPRILILIHGKD